MKRLKILEDRILDLESRGTFHEQYSVIEPKSEDAYHVHNVYPLRRSHMHVKEEKLYEEESAGNDGKSLKEELENVTSNVLDENILSFDEECQYDSFMDDQEANDLVNSAQPVSAFQFSKLHDVRFKFAEEDAARSNSKMNNRNEQDKETLINKRIQ